MKAPRLIPSLRVLGGTLGGQWERDRRDTLFLMAAIALTVVPSFAHLPGWCTTVFCVLFVWRGVLIVTGHPLPSGAVRLGIAAVCTAGVLAEHGTLFGRQAGEALLVLFLGLKLMEMRVRRDLFVVIFLCFFLLLTAFFHSQTPWSAGTTLVAIFALVSTMITLQFGVHEPTLRHRLTLSATLMLQAVPVAAVLFVLFPRASGPLWGTPEDSQAGRTGLSDTMTPGQVSDLARNQEVAFRVQFEGDTPASATLYWRGPTLGHHDGRTWSPVQHEVSTPPRPEAELPPDGQPVRYRLTLEPHGQRWLFALDIPVEVPRAPGVLAAVGPQFDAAAADPLHERIRVDLSSRLDARIGLNETRLSLQNWLQLPPSHHRRTLAMAARWRAEEQDDRVLVRRALAMFRDAGFDYTLTPPLLANDSVDRFLFETRAGFCEHFASAFVVLMRALDIPARVVTGYQGGEANPNGGYWIVRQSDAHAWAEVWLAGQGWVRVDPTAAVAPDRIRHGASAVNALGAEHGSMLSSLIDLAVLRQWRFSFDSLANTWNQWVLNYDRGRQQALLSRLGLRRASAGELLGALAGVLGLLVAAMALHAVRPRTQRDPVERAYDIFCERIAALGSPRQRDETATRYLRRIDRLLEPIDVGRAREIVATYNRLRYDPVSSTPEHIRHFQRMVRDFKPS